MYKYPIDQKEVDIQTVSKDKVQILAKCNNPHLYGIDRFMKVELLDEFYSVEPLRVEAYPRATKFQLKNYTGTERFFIGSRNINFIRKLVN